MNTADQKSRLSATLAGVPTAVLGVAVLLGWVADSAILTSVGPGFVAMNPLTAVGFVLGGVCLYLLREQSRPPMATAAARVFALALVAIGLVKILDYVFQLDLRIDRILFAAELGDNFMAPNTAACFALAGLSLFTLDWVTARGFWPALVPAILLALISSVSLIGYAYGASSMYRVSSHIPMALNTAMAFVLISAGILLCRPERGIAKVLFSRNQGGMMARRLLPIGILVPVAVGWLRVWGQRAGWYETEVGTSIMVALTAIMFAAAVLVIANQLNISDEQRKQSALKLERQSEEIRDLYDNAPCGYHSLDLNGVYVSINKTELAWLGYTREEIVGKKKFSDVIKPSGLQGFIDSYRLFKEQGYVKDLEFELLRKDGTSLPVILNSTAIRAPDGTYLASRTTLFDATERKRIENAMRSFNAELESRVAERTEQLRLSNTELTHKNRENEMFVYSVSHDLRSPLVNLQGFSQELETVSQDVRELVACQLPAETASKIVGLIDDDMRRCIQFIQTSVGRLGRIIDALLRLSRAGRVEYEPRAVDLNQTMRRVIEAMSSKIVDCGATVELRPLPIAWGDATALEQVFANLLSNAVNYLDPNRPGQIEIGSLPPNGSEAETTYYVKDNGLGIAPAYHEKVFQALKRLHPKVPGGEGVGLALVKRMVERHNGAIWFESAENAGATFFVRLPRPALSLAPSEAPHPALEASDQFECHTHRHLVS